MKIPPVFDSTERIGAAFLLLTAVIVAAFLMVPPGLSFTGPLFSGHGDIHRLSRNPDSSPLPDSEQFDAELSKGKFLVASRNLGDPRFRETVVLLIGHHRLGAVGLIINRPTRLSLAEAFPDVPALTKRTDALYFGGPVEGRQALLLIRSPGNPGESERVFDGVYVSSSMAVLSRMIDRRRTGRHFRVYAGYAGWSPGQLEREVRRGDWHVVHADAKTIFEKKAGNIWPEMILRGTELLVWDPGRLGRP
jgi:putative transcriptional regulator